MTLQPKFTRSGSQKLPSHRVARAGSGTVRQKRRLLLVSVAAGSVVVLAFGWWALRRELSPVSRLEPSTAANQKSAPNLKELLAFSSLQVEQSDIAVLNLLCAEGLRGAESVKPEAALTTIDHWAERVRSETERNIYQYRSNPKGFENSEPYFRVLIMAAVVHDDFRVRYNPALISAPGETDANDRFFADSRDVFLHGLCGSRRMGTCSSMPVLYVALGRRLGYPLKLVTTKSHLFIRWDGPAEQFDLEATGRGMNRYDDEHFKHWPFEVTEAEIQTDGYLKSLNPAEELALFLSLRGHCLKEAGRLNEAIAAYAEASRWAPDSRAYQALLADARTRLSPPPSSRLAQRPLAAVPALSPARMSVPAIAGQPPDPNPLLKLR